MANYLWKQSSIFAKMSLSKISSKCKFCKFLGKLSECESCARVLGYSGFTWTLSIRRNLSHQLLLLRFSSLVREEKSQRFSPCSRRFFDRSRSFVTTSTCSQATAYIFRGASVLAKNFDLRSISTAQGGSWSNRCSANTQNVFARVSFVTSAGSVNLEARDDRESREHSWEWVEVSSRTVEAGSRNEQVHFSALEKLQAPNLRSDYAR